MKKVLVVDDDPTVRHFLKSLLTTDGLNVVTVDDGIDAMVRIKKEKPDLLMLDVMMPELNGYEVCRYIKFSDDLKHIPIIILTSRTKEIDPKIGSLVGIDYLHKTCSAAELLSAIRKALPEHGAA